MDLVGPAGVIAQAVDHQRQVGIQALADRLAIVERFELGELMNMRLDKIGEFVHQAPAVAGIHLAPGARVKRLAGRLDRQVDIGGVSLRDLGDDVLGRRIERLRTFCRWRYHATCRRSAFSSEASWRFCDAAWLPWPLVVLPVAKPERSSLLFRSSV